MEKPTLEKHIDTILELKTPSRPFMDDALAVAEEVRKWRIYYKGVNEGLNAVRFKLGTLAADYPSLFKELEGIATILDEFRRFPFTEQESYSLLK